MQRTPGGRVAPQAYMPPRGRSDLSCINCGKKGEHQTKDCPMAQQDKSKRPCFNCGKPGCIARTCPQKKRPGIKMIADAQPVVPQVAPVAMVSAAGRPKASIFALTVAPEGEVKRRPQETTLADFMVPKQSKQHKLGKNRFIPLIDDDDADVSSSPSGGVTVAEVLSASKNGLVSEVLRASKLTKSNEVLRASKRGDVGEVLRASKPSKRASKTTGESVDSHFYASQSLVEHSLAPCGSCVAYGYAGQSMSKGSSKPGSVGSLLGVTKSRSVVNADASVRVIGVEPHVRVVDVNTCTCVDTNVDITHTDAHTIDTRIDVTCTNAHTHDASHTPHIARNPHIDTSHIARISQIPSSRPTFSPTLQVTPIPSCRETPIARSSPAPIAGKTNIHTHHPTSGHGGDFWEGRVKSEILKIERMGRSPTVRARGESVNNVNDQVFGRSNCIESV